MTTLSPLWLLPVVTLIVCSSTGQLLADALIHHSLSHAFLTIGVSIVLVVIGTFLALMILTLYFRRLLIEGLPDVGVIISSFVPLGPCGQAGYSLLLAGQNFRATLPWGGGNVLGDELTGRVLSIVCFFAAFILWCMGLWWLLAAIMAVGDTLVRGKKIPFKLAFWGLVFPNVRLVSHVIPNSIAHKNLWTLGPAGSAYDPAGSSPRRTALPRSWLHLCHRCPSHMECARSANAVTGIR